MRDFVIFEPNESLHYISAGLTWQLTVFEVSQKLHDYFWKLLGSEAVDWLIWLETIKGLESPDVPLVGMEPVN